MHSAARSRNRRGGYSMTGAGRHGGGRVIMRPDLMQLLYRLPQRAGVRRLDGQSLQGNQHNQAQQHQQTEPVQMHRR